MPNWCENDLIIYGKREKILRCLETVKTEEREFDFDTIIPYPKVFKNLDKKAEEWDKKRKTEKLSSFEKRPKDGYNQGGYQWCVENWNTKWNACKVKVESVSKGKNANTIIHFDTAWSPPIGVIHELSIMFPELHFILKYYEGGMGFQGTYRVKNSVVLEDVASDYHGSRGG